MVTPEDLKLDWGKGETKEEKKDTQALHINQVIEKRSLITLPL